MATRRHTKDLRRRTTQGVLINTGFTVGLQTVAFLRSFSVAAFISVSDYGVWGTLIVGMMLLAWVANAGIDSKYVQQDEDDQELAFQKAFTLQLQLSFVVVLLSGLSVPIVVAIYDEPRLWAPAFLLVATVPLTALQAPMWTYGRDMDYFRQRVIQAAEPITSIAVTTALAATGGGYWSLVWGVVAGRLAGAALAVAMSPYQLRIRSDRGTLKEYWSFSWPLMGAGACAMLIPQSTILATDWQTGVAGVGAVALAQSITAYTDRVDQILSSTLYPALCAAKDRLNVLRESFVKSNRLAMMWAVPLGVGLTLFGPDFVDFVLGNRWDDSTFLIQAFGLAAAIGHVGYNWSAYYMVQGTTRPQIWFTLAMTTTWLAIPIPLLIAYGLDGLGVGMIIHTALKLPLRGYWMRKLFPGFGMVAQTVRGFAPAVPAVAVVLLLRLAESGPRSGQIAALEVLVFLGVFALSTFAFERPLLREVLGYLRRRRSLTTAVAS